jgi:hypothetical protein
METKNLSKRLSGIGLALLESTKRRLYDQAIIRPNTRLSYCTWGVWGHRTESGALFKRHELGSELRHSRLLLLSEKARTDRFDGIHNISHDHGRISLKEVPQLFESYVLLFEDVLTTFHFPIQHFREGG